MEINSSEPLQAKVNCVSQRVSFSTDLSLFKGKCAVLLYLERMVNLFNAHCARNVLHCVVQVLTSQMESQRTN